jgi:hypothetical protein
VFRAEENEPRGIALRTQLESTQAELSSMVDLFMMLKTEPQIVANTILSKIRSGTELRTVLSDLDTDDDQASDLTEAIARAGPFITSGEGLDSRAGAIHPRNGSQVNLLGGIIDAIMSPEEVNRHMSQTGEHIWQGVSRWTRLTSNDALVSHLVHVYFDHQHWMCNFIDRQLFLEDFANGESNFCSAVLVNAILANASVST